MMGMLIFTLDAEPYRVGEYIEGDGFFTSPSIDATIICHIKRPDAKDCLGWLDYINYRMVIVCDKAPKIDDSRVIYDRSLNKKGSDYIPAIQATLRWQDRNRVWNNTQRVPVPLMLSFLRENVKDIDIYRLLAKSFRWCAEDMQQAAICFGVSPVKHRPAFPKKKKKVEVCELHMFRESDKYRDMIIRDGQVANLIRAQIPKDELPKKMKKTKEKVVSWL
jgi:hypothetical protein